MEEKEVTSLKPDYITTMIKTGSSDIATGDADGFYIQMMNAAPQLFDKALDIASQEEFRVVLRELRYYQDTIVKTNIEGQAARERMLSLEHTAADAAAHGSTIYKDIAILLGGALLGWGGKSFYDHFIKKR